VQPSLLPLVLLAPEVLAPVASLLPLFDPSPLPPW
jgi:hypothetical protein